jgi:murein tripeptide amidase MpaA
MPSPAVHVPFDRYLDFAEMTAALQALAAAYPRLARLTQVATSFQGRAVWLMTITNPDTGADHDKPGFYIDAQIHAEEHATSATALYAIHHLLTRYGSDEEVTRLVDQQVFYILPRLNPDGAEFALKPPYHPWCGNGRVLPGQERTTGLTHQDIDGDGYITTMRVPDPKGEWKLHPTIPDLMVQREAGEEGGQYHRVYPEGTVIDWNGVEPHILPQQDGNMNRNFPINWSPREYGGGAYPFSEPEAMGQGRVILDNPNIAGMCAYHTHGGIILRASMMKYDRDMSPRDLALYRALGEVGTRITRYPTISTYEDFTPDKSKARHGSLKDWVYEEMGIICFSTELWDIETAAGVKKRGYYNLGPADADVQEKLYLWVKENVGDHGFRPWTRVQHPKLGEVEVGGFVYIWSYRNPPSSLLEEVCAKNVAFNLRHAAAAPRVRVDRVEVEALGADLFRVRAVVANHGYLPTNLSDVAVEKGVAVPVRAEISVAGGELLMNPASQTLGHLSGRNERRYEYSNWGQQWGAVAKPVEWLVRGGPGATVTVAAVSQKGGTHRETAALG